MRANAAAAQSEPLRRERWKGEEYIVEDVIAQREGVYEYPSPGPRQGITREFLSADTLAAGMDEWEGQTLVLRHPENDDGEFITVNEVPITEIGAFRNVDISDDALVGEVWIQESEVGEHDGDLEEYIDDLAAGEYGEVSTGYEVESFTEEPGRYNGQQYDREQAALSPDHLALLPDEPGNCSVAEGCGVGRANSSESTPVRVNQTAPDSTPEVDEGTVRGIIGALSGFLSDGARGDAGSPTTNTGTDASDEAAESARDESAPDTEDADDEDGDGPDDSGSDSDPASTDTDTMEDSDKIDTLVEEHGFDRENVEQWEGEQCLDRLFNQFEDDAAPDDEGDDNGTDDSPDGEDTDDTEGGTDVASPETADSPDGGDAGETGEVTANMDDIREVVREELTRAETEAAKDENVQMVANNANAPFERDDLEDMDADAVAKIADKYPGDDGGDDATGGQARANYAGKPTGRSSTRANEGDDGPTAPAAGANRTVGAETEGDD